MRHIICFGNPLHGDDGFGPAVFKRLSGLASTANTRVFDAGTPGLNAMLLFKDCSDVIIVDAIASCGQPGCLHLIDPQEITSEYSVTGHGAGVAYLLQALSVLDESLPRIQILGVEALSVASFQPGLSVPVSRAVDDAVVYLAPYFEM